MGSCVAPALMIVMAAVASQSSGNGLPKDDPSFSSSIRNDPGRTFAHDMNDVQWTVGLVGQHDGADCRFVLDFFRTGLGVAFGTVHSGF